MQIALNTLIVLATFGGMEFMAWFTHKYVMHGLLWRLHEDHHIKGKSWFERNDVFFLIFAVPSWLLIMFGMMAGNDFRVWIGVGIAAYGLAYFLVHDIFIHQRFKLFTRTDHAYLKAIRKAHKVHHKKRWREDGECFGMLLVPPKFYREARESQARKNANA